MSLRATDVAKKFVWERGFRTAFVAEDGLDYNDSGRAFTENQLAKVEEQRQKLVDRFAEKFKIDKKDRKPLPRPAANSAG